MGAQLNQFLLTDLRLDEKAIVQFVSAETSLIHKLAEQRELINPSFEKEGTERMRAVERTDFRSLPHPLAENQTANACANSNALSICECSMSSGSERAMALAGFRSDIHVSEERLGDSPDEAHD